MIVQQIVNGLTIGCTYGLVALGYSLIFGVLGLINFAHGEIYMVGAFLAFTFASMLKLPFLLSLLISVCVSALVGVAVEVLAYRPVRKADRSSQLISALAMSIVLRNGAMLIWGSRTMPFPRFMGSGFLELGRIRLSVLQIAIPAVALVLMVLLRAFVKYTRLGISVRAVSLDLEMSSLMGIDCEKVIAVVFGLGSALGAIAGVLLALFYSSVSFDMGVMVGIKSFVAAILGGIGSIDGAMLGGLILGVSETLAAAYISPAYKDALAFCMLVIILLVKPRGLLGISAEKGG